MKGGGTAPPPRKLYGKREEISNQLVSPAYKEKRGIRRSYVFG